MLRNAGRYLTVAGRPHKAQREQLTLSRESDMVRACWSLGWPAAAVWAVLGHGEQYGGVFDRFEGMPCGGHDEEIPRGAIPFDVACAEAHPPVRTCTVDSPGLSCSSSLWLAASAIRVWRSTCSWPPYTVCALRPLEACRAIFSCSLARAVSDNFSIDAPFRRPMRGLSVELPGSSTWWCRVYWHDLVLPKRPRIRGRVHASRQMATCPGFSRLNLSRQWGRSYSGGCARGSAGRCDRRRGPSRLGAARAGARPGTAGPYWCWSR
jgi:hypothetical protein